MLVMLPTPAHTEMEDPVAFLLPPTSYSNSPPSPQHTMATNTHPPSASAKVTSPWTPGHTHSFLWGTFTCCASQIPLTVGSGQRPSPRLVAVIWGL